MKRKDTNFFNNKDFVKEQRENAISNVKDTKNDEYEDKDKDEEDGCVDCGCHISKKPSKSSAEPVNLRAKPTISEKSKIAADKDDGDEQDEDDEDEEDELKKSKWLIMLGLVFTIPLVTIEILFGEYSMSDYVLLMLATPVQFFLGKPFYLKFYYSIKRKRFFTINTLVVISTTIAYVYSLISLATGQQITFFEASASVLTIFTIGEYLEARVLKSTSESLRSLLDLKPKTATVVRGNGKQETINVDDLAVGDVFVVKPGENIATDGVVVVGQSSVDESMITGESIPVDKIIGDKVIGGTINKNGYIQVKTINVGNQTVLANIVEMVRKARITKPSIQRIADTAAKYFIPIVFVIALVSSLYWLIIQQMPIQFVVTVFATVLVVSCPCALGIATPMVVSLGVGRAARKGVLIKGGKYLEKLASVDTIVFDKTGTLTEGKPKVTDVIAIEGYSKDQVLQLAFSTEIKSEHPIAHAIVNKASEQNLSPLNVTEFNSITGHGVVARLDGEIVSVLSPRLRSNNYDGQEDMLPNLVISKDLQSTIQDLETSGKTVITVFMGENLIGLIAVADKLRDNAIHMLERIKSSGKDVVLLSGDNKRTANAIAKKLGINKVLAEVLPQQKANEIKNLQEKRGRVVAMVGDGINDAPALTQADVGIAMGSGTDVAIASGHVILLKNDLDGILYTFKLAEYSLKKIKQNLTISFAYNSITIPIAAGLFFGFTNSLILTPALAALGWVVSDSLVFGNSLLLRRFKT